MLRLAGLTFVFAVCLIIAVPDSHADKRLEIFLQKSEKFLERHKPLNHVDSPFRPYLQRPFEEGLDEKALDKFRQARGKGDCIIVENLQKQGFLGLYPFLKPAFDDSKRGRTLRAKVSISSQPGRRLCYNNYQLIRLFSRKPKKEFPPVDLGLRMAIGPFVRPGDESNPLANLITLRFVLGDMAFCDDYAPAIEAVLDNANRAGGIVVAQEEELYLTLRALKKDPNTPKIRERLARLEANLPAARFRAARGAAAERRLDALEIVSGFWWKACRELQDYLQKKGTAVGRGCMAGGFFQSRFL